MIKRSLSEKVRRMGAVFDASQVAVNFGDPAGERATAARLGLVDLSFAPRWGFKGPASVAALEAASLSKPAGSNLCVQSTRGPIVASLSPTEFFVAWNGIADEASEEALKRQIASFGEECYFVDHFHGMFCFALLGSMRERLYQRCCAVDLSRQNASIGRVLQTRVHHVDAIILRCVSDGGRDYDLLFGDIATATHVWERLMETISEIGGAAVGFDAFRAVLA
jgi:heterotetrameric sarcosine oxidase gamma subunit